jgi:hypothetical protein
MLMMKKPKNLEFEPVHPKNVLLASVVHGFLTFEGEAVSVVQIFADDNGVGQTKILFSL